MEYEAELAQWAADAEVAFGARLKEIREARGISQGQLARIMTRLGFKMHQSSIAKMERDIGQERRPIRLGEALLLSILFGQSVYAMTPAAPRQFDADAARIYRSSLRDKIQVLTDEMYEAEKRLDDIRKAYLQNKVAYDLTLAVDESSVQRHGIIGKLLLDHDAPGKD